MSVGLLDHTTHVIETIRFDVHGDQPYMRRNRLRYAAPSEIDLMALVHGLHLSDRFVDYAATPYTPDATTAISVYRATG